MYSKDVVGERKPERAMSKAENGDPRRIVQHGEASSVFQPMALLHSATRSTLSCETEVPGPRPQVLQLWLETQCFTMAKSTTRSAVRGAALPVLALRCNKDHKATGNAHSHQNYSKQQLTNKLQHSLQLPCNACRFAHGPGHS